MSLDVASLELAVDVVGVGVLGGVTGSLGQTGELAHGLPVGLVGDGVGVVEVGSRLAGPLEDLHFVHVSSPAENDELLDQVLSLEVNDSHTDGVVAQTGRDHTPSSVSASDGVVHTGVVHLFQRLDGRLVLPALEGLTGTLEVEAALNAGVGHDVLGGSFELVEFTLNLVDLFVAVFAVAFELLHLAHKIFLD